MIRAQRRRKPQPWPCCGAWCSALWDDRANAELMQRHSGPFAPTRAGRRVPRLPTFRRVRFGTPGWVTRRWHVLMYRAWGFPDA